MNDWTFEDEDGELLTITYTSYEYLVWKWTPRIPVPYKQNKHRYGR